MFQKHTGAFLLLLLFVIIVAAFAFSYALSPAEAAALFNIFVGIMLTAALLLFVGGVGAYFARLGTWPSNRDGALKIMEWGVVTLFVLIVILAIVQFFERNPTAATTVAIALAILLVLGLVAYIFMNARKKEKKEGPPS